MKFCNDIVFELLICMGYMRRAYNSSMRVAFLFCSVIRRDRMLLTRGRHESQVDTKLAGSVCDRIAFFRLKPGLGRTPLRLCMTA
jgi:hypothetical protein